MGACLSGPDGPTGTVRGVGRSRFKFRRTLSSGRWKEWRAEWERCLNLARGEMVKRRGRWADWGLVVMVVHLRVVRRCFVRLRGL